MLGIPHEYMTPQFPGVGGVIKSTPSDFQVEEIPLYSPCGEGEHTYFEIEKIDLSTLEAVDRLSKSMGVRFSEFGYAGLKDRKGVTRQILSLRGITPAEAERIDVPGVRILWAERHTNKLRIGHLRGNRFKIIVRDVAHHAPETVAAILAVVKTSGVPNYFGPQRFGNRGDAHFIGRAFLARDDRGAIRRILGCPSGSENNPRVIHARTQFMAGKWRDAYESFPQRYQNERMLLQYLLEHGSDFSGARRRMRVSALRLYLSAYQSYLFNVSLAERLRRTNNRLAELWEGDLAFLHRNGAVFAVKDPVVEQPRADRFEISPSGPIFGGKMPVPSGQQGEIETELLEREEYSRQQLSAALRAHHLNGERRALRVEAKDLTWRLDGADLYVEFELPKGSYATTLLREVMKNDAVPEEYFDDGEGEKHHLWRPASDSESSGERPQERIG